MSERRVEVSEHATALGTLNKRELFALVALQGILAHAYNDASYEGAARDATAYADQLLEELAK